MGNFVSRNTIIKLELFPVNLKKITKSYLSASDPRTGKTTKFNAININDENKIAIKKLINNQKLIVNEFKPIHCDGKSVIINIIIDDSTNEIIKLFIN